MNLKILKSIYSYIPFKKEIFTILKKVWTPPHNVYKHLHFKGVIKVPLKGNKGFKMKHYGYEVENDLFWCGIGKGWERYSIDLWLKLCKQADVVFDIGANTGVYALMANTINPQSKIFAFEPVHKVFQKLKNNVELNKYEITCV